MHALKLFNVPRGVWGFSTGKEVMKKSTEKKEAMKAVLLDVDGTLVGITPSNGDEFEGVIPFGEEYWNKWNESTECKGIDWWD